MVYPPAAYRLSTENVLLPSGTFILPVCTTRERLQRILDSLRYASVMYPVGEYDHMIDVIDALARVRPGCEYAPEDNCSTVFPNDSRITWYPENPFNPGVSVPSGYNFHPYTVVDNSILDQILLQFVLGYRQGDVLTDFQKIPIGSSWNDLLTTGYLNFPRFRLDGLDGEGIVKIHLLGILQGGMAWVRLDDALYLNPLDYTLVELEMDITSFPPETEEEQIIEIEVRGQGLHHIDVIFLPRVDVDFIPLKFGGGLRYIELCGFNMPIPDPCCPDDSEINIRIYQQMQIDAAFILEMLDDGISPESFAPGSPDSFDTDTDDIGDDIAHRSNALCRAVKRYVYNVLYQWSMKIDAVSDAADTIASWNPFFSPIPAFFVDTWSPIVKQHLLDLINDCDAIAAVSCCMIDGLRGHGIDKSFFKLSVADCGFTFGSHEAEISAMVNSANQSDDSYRAFVRTLKGSFEGAKGGGVGAATASDCNCDCGCGDTIVLEDFAATGCTITHMHDCIYKFEQPDTYLGNAGVYIMSFRDIMQRCLNVEESDDPALVTTSVGVDTFTRDCMGGAEITFVGGFAPVTAKTVRWANPVSITYYKITLAVGG